MKLKILMLGDYGSIGQMYGLVTEGGKVLYTHICSNSSYAYGDLYGNRPERQEEIKNKYGEIEIINESYE